MFSTDKTPVMQKTCWQIASVGCLSLIETLSALVFILPLQAQPKTPDSSQRLSNMFSTDIRKTLSACSAQGRVNIAAGSAQNGSVICGDGSSTSSVQFNDYVNTLSDFLTASFLVGYRKAMKANPQLASESATSIWQTPTGKILLQQLLEKYLAQSQLLPQNSTQSVSLLVNNIIQRSLPTLQNPSNLENLLGTSNQYKLVVENFCTPPGKSVAQAQTLAPGLSSVQMYAICVKESGIVDEIPKAKS